MEDRPPRLQANNAPSTKHLGVGWFKYVEEKGDGGLLPEQDACRLVPSDAGQTARMQLRRSHLKMVQHSHLEVDE